MYIFMEYCDEGTLEEVSKLGLQEHVIRLYTKQITIAINVLHEHGIVHRDIKGNVNQKGNVVLVLQKKAGGRGGRDETFFRYSVRYLYNS